MITTVSEELVRLINPDHRYLVGEGITEREAPSLSRVLENAGFAVDYSSVDPDHLAFRSRVGTLTHQAIEAYLDGFEPQGVLDDDDDRFLALHSQPHLDAFIAWARDHDLKPVFHEVPAYNPDWRYACTADFVGELDGDPWVLDWKTSYKISKTTALQTMGQRQCFKFDGDREPCRGALHLPKKGQAKLVEFKQHVQDYGTLQAIQTCWNQKALYLS